MAPRGQGREKRQVADSLATRHSKAVLRREQDMQEHLTEILSSYQGRQDDLIPILQEVQHAFGYLPQLAMKRIAKFLKLPESSVFGVGTFYAQFKLVPSGRNIVKICRGTACHVRGATDLIDEVGKQLGIKPGETTSDFEYSLEATACFGSCALAPVVVIGQSVYGRMTPAKMGQLLRNAEGEQ